LIVEGSGGKGMSGSISPSSDRSSSSEAGISMASASLPANGRLSSESSFEPFDEALLSVEGAVVVEGDGTGFDCT
jgi:hypothetical protein